MVKAHSRRPNVLTQALEEASVAAHDADPSELLGCICGSLLQHNGFDVCF